MSEAEKIFETSELRVVGKFLGTYTSWNEMGTLDLFFYDFTPAPGIAIPAGDLSINYETGEMTVTGEEWKVLWTGNFLSLLMLASL